MNKKLQVFVSSTYTDLIEERQAAVEAILDAGHIPAGMELFKAGNESQLKTIYKWIDESDVYMLILGGRYGSIETNSQKSYTQLEYEYALSKGIPVFAVILSDLFLTHKINSLGYEKVTEQNAPDKYQSFKSLVMSKIIRKADDNKDIKIVIHSTLNEFMNEYDLIGWIRNDTNKNYTILLDENNSLKIEVLKLQKELDNIDKNFNNNISNNALISILKSANFDYYDNTNINALCFFLLNYYKCVSEYYFNFDDKAYPILLFLEKLTLVKIVHHSEGGGFFHHKESFQFALTQYGIDFYKDIEKYHSHLLSDCKEHASDYFENKVFYDKK